MHVLVAHSRYRRPGGEEAVVEAECALLRSAGVRVTRYERDNAEVEQASAVRTALGTTWSPRAHRELRDLVLRHRPDVVHVHNTFPVMSPAVLPAARAAGAAVVQTLHNYRLACPGATLLRDEQPCEACVGGAVPWRGIAHGCYRGSRSHSAAVALMLAAHRARRTWQRDVDAFITLTEFARGVLVRAGLPAERMHVKPNFVRDPGPAARHELAPDADARPYVLFVGRLAPEKGVGLLADAWKLAVRPGVRLVIAGDGPERPRVEQLVAESAGSVELLGHLPPADVARWMSRARSLVMPSRWYETFGLTAIESFAAARPVIAPGHGALGELVEDGVTGWTFAPGDAPDLARCILAALDADGAADVRGARARAAWHDRFAPAANLAGLLDIYEAAVTRRAAVA
jgi:glycosyltransferase involved in cell wall biosynthesis